MNAPAQRLVRGTAAESRSSTRQSVGDAVRTVGAPGVAAALAIGVMALIAGSHPLVPVASSVTVAVLVTAGLVDLAERRLPNRIVALAAGILAFGLALQPSGVTATDVATGMALLAGPLLLLHVISPTAMGFGDVKVALVLGAAVGAVDWQLAVVTLALASGVTATVALIRHMSHIAFGPGLVAAAAVSLAAHPILLTATVADATTNIGLLLS